MRASSFNGGGVQPEQPWQGGQLRHSVHTGHGVPNPTHRLQHQSGDRPKYMEDLYFHWYNYMLTQTSISQTISTSYGGNEKTFPVDYTRNACNLFAHLGAHSVGVFFSSGDYGVGRWDCKDGSGNVWFVPHYPALCTSCVIPLLASSTQAQVQVVHHTAMLSQVPGSPALAARHDDATTLRLRGASPAAASQTIFHAQATRMARHPPPSSTFVAGMPASTSAFAVVT